MWCSFFWVLTTGLVLGLTSTLKKSHREIMNFFPFYPVNLLLSPEHNSVEMSCVDKAWFANDIWMYVCVCVCVILVSNDSCLMLVVLECACTIRYHHALLHTEILRLEILRNTLLHNKIKIINLQNNILTYRQIYNRIPFFGHFWASWQILKKNNKFQM